MTIPVSATRTSLWRSGGSPLPTSRLLGAATWFSLVAAAVGVAAFVAVPGLRGRDVPALALIGLLLGAPHGAVDHLLPQSGAWSQRGGSLLRRAIPYVGVVAVVLAISLVTPVIGIALIIVLSVVHLGACDAALRHERRYQIPRFGFVAILAYGGPIGFVSFARWPAEVREIFRVISPDIADVLRLPMYCAAVATVLAIGVFVVAAARERAWLDVAEVMVLLALFLAVPPLAAFGIYFAMWHSLRQYVRLYADARGESEPAKGNYPLPRVLNMRTLFTTMLVGSLAAAVILAVATLAALHSHADFVQRFQSGDWLTILLVAVIAPHMVTILRYDRWKAAHARIAPSVTQQECAA